MKEENNLNIIKNDNDFCIIIPYKDHKKACRLINHSIILMEHEIANLKACVLKYHDSDMECFTGLTEKNLNSIAELTEEITYLNNLLAEINTI